jgi:pullulanase/glycogen debranching enzyme
VNQGREKRPFPNQASNAYHACQSVNLVAAHDGFTMYDLVSYDKLTTSSD